MIKIERPKKSLPEVAAAILNHNEWQQSRLFLANKARCDLQGFDLTEHNPFANVNLSNSLLNDTDISGVIFYRTNFSGTCLRGASASNSIFFAVDFTQASLAGANLEGTTFVNCILRYTDFSNANLTGANFSNCTMEQLLFRSASLQAARFIGAVIRTADVTDADLTKAVFAGADLCDIAMNKARKYDEAVFFAANLKKNDLVGIRLPRCDLRHAILAECDLSGAYLHHSNLRGADLWRAKLSGSHCWHTDFRQSKLIQATFDSSWSNVDGQVRYHEPADLTKADLRDAHLRDARLSEVRGLESHRLGGAVLTNAKLPAAISTFQGLTTAANISQNGQTVFFGVLAACLYSYLIVATTTDAKLFADTPASTLPFMTATFPLRAFYTWAPFILLTVYVYFLLYLQRLWLTLSTLPAVFPDGRPLDEHAYPWMMSSLVRRYLTRLRNNVQPGQERPSEGQDRYLTDGVVDIAKVEREERRDEQQQRSMVGVEISLSIFLGWALIPLTMFIVWMRYIPSRNILALAWNGGLIILACVIGAVTYRYADWTFKRSLVRSGFAESDLMADPLAGYGSKGTIRRGLRTGLGLMVMAASILGIFATATFYPRSAQIEWKDLPGLELRYEAVLAHIDWMLGRIGFRTAPNIDGEIMAIKAADLPNGIGAAIEDRAAGVDLRGLDLRHMSARAAYLRGGNLRGADLRWADLGGADLAGGDLADADLSFSNLRGVQLSGAKLAGANLANATLDHANFAATDLTETQVDPGALSAACGDDATVWPAGVQKPSCVWKVGENPTTAACKRQ